MTLQLRYDEIEKKYIPDHNKLRDTKKSEKSPIKINGIGRLDI